MLCCLILQRSFRGILWEVEKSGKKVTVRNIRKLRIGRRVDEDISGSGLGFRGVCCKLLSSLSTARTCNGPSTPFRFWAFDLSHTKWSWRITNTTQWKMDQYKSHSQLYFGQHWWSPWGTHSLYTCIRQKNNPYKLLYTLVGTIFIFCRLSKNVNIS